MKKIIYWILKFLIITLSVAGTLLYYLGKLIKALGYLCKGYTGSAKREVTDFLAFKYDASDL